MHFSCCWRYQRAAINQKKVFIPNSETEYHEADCLAEAVDARTSSSSPSRPINPLCIVHPAGLELTILAVSGHRQVMSIVVLDSLDGEATQKDLTLDVVDTEVGEHMLARARLTSKAGRVDFNW